MIFLVFSYNISYFKIYSFLGTKIAIQFFLASLCMAYIVSSFYYGLIYFYESKTYFL